MNREPIGMYIFRILVSCCILFFAGMIYWSSTQVEEGVLNLRNDMATLKNEISSLEDSIKTMPRGGSQNLASTSPSNTFRSLMDAALPNLLKEDPYYLNTLPKQLGPDFKPYGILHTSTIGKYDNTLPFSEWMETAVWNEWCGVAVAAQQFGKYETLAPDMAIKMEERPAKEGGKEYWIHLRDNVYWEPLKQSFFSNDLTLAPHFLQKHQVTADDFKFYYDAIMNPYISSAGAVSWRTYYQDIVEFRVIDKFTFVVRWKEKAFDIDGKEVLKSKYTAKALTGGLRPMASFVYKYYSNGKKIVENDQDAQTYRTNAIWAQGFSQHWARNIMVSCGPWTFDGRTERQVNFKRNKNYYNSLAALMEGREVHIKESTDNAWLDFKGDKLTTYVIQPDQLIEFNNFQKSEQYKEQAANQAAIEKLEYFSRTFSYIGWNLTKPFFKNEKVRQALTMAIDRDRIINQFLNGMGMQLTGPSYPFDRSYDQSIKPWPYDIQAAKRLLEQEGWYDHNGDGIIDKEIDGQSVPFRFTLNYMGRGSMARNIAEFIATSLKEVGIDCKINGLDTPEMSNKIADKNFDALMLAWSLGSPPEDHRQLWYTDKGDEKGSSNYISFSNAEVDRIIDALDYESNPQRRIELYHAFQRIIHEQAPYVFLFCPKATLLYREYLQNVFIPKDRQDLIPGADVAEPESSVFWLKKR